MNVRQVIPPDAIPSVDDPEFGDSYEGNDEDRVIAVTTANTARAYPIRYLNYHEIVNDVLPGGTPVAVTWCPLCGSAVVYERRVGDRTLTFGVSGKLADDDLVMYDRETESEWKQSLGRAIAGPHEGETLGVIPAAELTWARFREEHPDGLVLQPPGGQSEAGSDDDTPAPIEYEDDPYAEYFDGEGFGLAARRGDDSRDWPRDDIAPKTVVLGLEADGDALGVPLPVLEDAGGLLRVTVGETDALVVAGDAGIHAFRDPGFDIEPTEAGFQGDGTTWDGVTGEADDGRQLDRLPAKRLFAFAWRDDHGDAAFLTADPSAA